jgi:hypothetical protein
VLTPAQQVHLHHSEDAPLQDDDLFLVRQPRASAPATTLEGMWPDTRVRFIRYHDQVYQFNGLNRMRAFTGEDWRYAGITPPATAPTVATSPAGTELSGDYLYYITAANTRVRVGDLRYVESLPVAATSTVSPLGERVVVTLPASHPDPQVTHWIIYRNKNGYYDTNVDDEEQDFFKVAEVPIGTTTYTDTTADDLLEPFPVLSFKNEVPPVFKYGAIYDNRFYGCGMDEFTAGSVTVDSADATLLTFSQEMPDGLVGCHFRKAGEARFYTIDARVSSTQFRLSSAFLGQLSGASYVIFRDPSMLYYSEQINAEAWGLEGEFQRNQQPVGGPGSQLKLTGLYTAHGRLYIFTLDQVYVLYSQGDNLQISVEPLLDGIGCVSSDTVVKVDDTLYWLSLQGPVAYNPSLDHKAVRIGTPLGTDWLSTLNASNISIACGAYQPLLHTIKWAVPLAGASENGYVYVYDIGTGTWWPEEDWTPTLYWNDYDSTGQPKMYSGVGRQFFLEDAGTNDGVPSGTKTGAVTSYDSNTKTVLVTGASFYTSGYGLEDRWVHFYRLSNGSYIHVGKSRIVRNTDVTLVLRDNVAIQANDVFYVGPVTMRWQTKTFAVPAKNHRTAHLHTRFQLQAESTPSSIFTLDTQDGTVQTKWDNVAVNQTSKKFPVFARGPHYSKKLEVRATDAQIAIRSLDLETDVDEDKP